MSAVVHNGGLRVWGGKRDTDGYREFTVTHLVKTTDVRDCPYTVMFAAGLPAIGSVWNLGNNADVWAFCYPDMEIRRHPTIAAGEKGLWWEVDQKFSTKPLSRCQDTQVEDPLLEPQKVSGNFGKFTIEAVYDRFGNLLKSSSHEQLRGRQVEFDNNKPSVTIEQNVASLGLSTFSQMIDTVNDAPMWGLPARCVKLSNAPWSRKVYGQCHYYYTRTFEFDIDYHTFDRVGLDEGTRVLHGHWGAGTGSGLTVRILTITSTGGIATISIDNGGAGYPESEIFQVAVTGGDGTGGVITIQTNSSGVVASILSISYPGKDYVVTPVLPATVATSTGTGWMLDLIDGEPPDPTNPQHFDRYKDRNGENTRAILNGAGCPVTSASLTRGLGIEYYGESNFFTLGVPVTF